MKIIYLFIIIINLFSNKNLLVNLKFNLKIIIFNVNGVKIKSEVYRVIIYRFKIFK